MAIKVKGILARPGRHKYGDHHEVITKEELQEAASRMPILPITLGHCEGGIPAAEKQIGTLHQKYDPTRELVRLEAWFWEEKISEELAENLRTGKPVPLSPAYRLSRLDEGTDGFIQRGRQYTHVAVVENPKLPGVGFHYAAEGDDKPAQIYRRDAPTLLGRAESEEKPAEPKPGEEPEFTPKQLAQIKALLDATQPPKPPEPQTTPAEQKPEEKPKPAPEKPPAPEPKPAPEPPEPAVRIPAGGEAQRDKGFPVSEDGYHYNTPEGKVKRQGTEYPKNTPGVVN